MTVGDDVDVDVDVDDVPMVTQGELFLPLQS
jgi:hypothetical protein